MKPPSTSLFLLGLLCLASAARAGERTGRLTLRFDEMSPLTEPDVLYRRIRFDAVLAKMEPDRRERCLKACRYDMRKESYAVYVPPAYDPARPSGLMVWISSSTSGAPPDDFLPVLERHNMIWAGANNAKAGGNSLIIRSLVLEAAYHVPRLFSIDRKRVYVANHHLGSKLAMAYPEVIRGVMIVGLVGYHKALPQNPRDGKYLYSRAGPLLAADSLGAAQRESSIALMISDDPAEQWRAKLVYEEGYMKDGFRNVEFITVPKARAEPINAEWLGRGIESLDKALVAKAESAFLVASEHLHRGRYAQALDALGGACHPGLRAPAAEIACALRARLLRERDEGLAGAKKAEAGGDHLQALSLYEKVFARFGPKHARGAADSVAKLKARPEVRAQIKAAEAERLRRQGEEKTKAEEERRRRAPTAALRLARNFIENGRNDLARKKLEDVIAKYPDTDEAREAKKLLARIQGR
ncbi:MAG: tetratricopeptide repeat protein [Planctomycetota bacterium]